jgi:hypothetical protein
MRLLAQARNRYSLQGLWIPGSRFARPGMTKLKLRAHPAMKRIYFVFAIFSMRRAITAQ